MARIEQSELALASKVSVDTIKRLERTIGPVSANVATVNSVVQALEAAGVEFTNGGQPGVRLKKGRWHRPPLHPPRSQPARDKGQSGKEIS
jgi:hypothetical protein